jgi:hypothetical protein
MSSVTHNAGQGVSEEYIRRIYQNLGELRGLAQLVVYLADQIEETDKRLDAASDPTQVAFLNRVLAMYTQELENRNQGLTGRISAITQDVSSRVRPSLFRWKNG